MHVTKPEQAVWGNDGNDGTECHLAAEMRKWLVSAGLGVSRVLTQRNAPIAI